MNRTALRIRVYAPSDESAVIDLWRRCGLMVPQNNPQKDIAAKRRCQPELFFVGVLADAVIATAMAGYDGHRGWVYYLAVDPEYRYRGFGRRIIDHVVSALRQRGCQKLNLQVRTANTGVLNFYRRLGFKEDDVLSLGKRL